MILKKKQLLIGKTICVISILVYLIFTLISDNTLIIIGNAIERIIGPSEVTIDTTREIIKTLSSGIFISAIVAIVFFYQEYKKIYEETVISIVLNSKKISQLYSKIPLLFDFDWDSDSVCKYYKEEFVNRRIQSFIDELNDTKYLHYSKNERHKFKKFYEDQKKYDNTNSLKKQLEAQINDEMSLEFELNRIYTSLDERITLCRSIYSELLKQDFNNIYVLRELLDPSKKVKLPTVLDKAIIGEKHANSKSLSAFEITSRLLDMHKRVQKLVNKNLSMENLDIDNADNCNLIYIFKEVQEHLFESEKQLLVLNDPSTEITILYSKISYVTENLHELLLNCVNDNLEMLDTTHFIKTNPRISQCTITGDEIALLMDIYQ